MGVDISNHVITHIQADHADKKDNQYLQSLTENIETNLRKEGMQISDLLADAGYSSGENYAYLEAKGIKSYIYSTTWNIQGRARQF